MTTLADVRFDSKTARKWKEEIKHGFFHFGGSFRDYLQEFVPGNAPKLRKHNAVNVFAEWKQEGRESHSSMVNTICYQSFHAC